jgi:uncharacterized protein (TIGR02594 family)
MRLIEKMWALIQAEAKKDWKEKPGALMNENIKKAFEEVKIDGLDLSDMDDGAIATCSILMNWICQKCGGTGTRSGLARSWSNWGRASDGKVGDIVILRRGTSSWQGHVTMLYKKNLLTVECLGFNQKNDLRISTYPRAQVIAYRTSKD